MKHRIELISKETVAEGTMAFHFTKPEGFAFKPGQNADFTLIDPPETDAEGNTRAFSIASAPGDSAIMIATRMRDTAFKRVLKSAEPGFAMEVEDPGGSFLLHQNAARPGIMLVGGIGITPFLSILTDAAQHHLPHTLYLFYSNRRPEDAAFLARLQELAKENPNMTLVATMTNPEGSAQAWEGERGYLTMDMLERHVPVREHAVYYAAGPQAMVSAMRKMLNDAGVGDDDIRTEEFSGY